MSSHFFPGLIGHTIGPIPHRIFLGAKKQVETLFLRQMQAVYPWLANAVKIRGAQGQEFYELDLSTNHDAEVLLRWCRVFHIRREVMEALIAKANEHMQGKDLLPKSETEESSKIDDTKKSDTNVEKSTENHSQPSRNRKDKVSDGLWYTLPDSETSEAIRSIWKSLDVRRLPYERRRLKAALQSNGVSLYDTETAAPREITNASSQSFNKQSCAHFLTASRYVVEDVLQERYDVKNAIDFERRAKYFLPRKRMETIIETLVTKELPRGFILKTELDGKAMKAVEKLLRCTDYRKLASQTDANAYVSQIRPFDMRSLVKFHILHRTSAEGIDRDAKKQWFAQCVWGSFLMKIVSHPGWVVHNSNAWQWELQQISEWVDPPKESTAEAPAVQEDKKEPRQKANDTKTEERTYRMPMALAMACHAAANVLPGAHIASLITLSLPSSTLTQAKAKSEWTDWHDNMYALPLPRVLPYIGNPIAIDLLAQLLVDAHWKKMGFALGENLASKKALAAVHEAFKVITAMEWDAVLKEAVGAAENLYGGLTDAENRWMSEIVS